MDHRIDRTVAPRGLLGAVWIYSKGARFALFAGYLGTVATNLAKLGLPLYVGVMFNFIQQGGTGALGRCRPVLLAMIATFAFLWVVRIPLKLAQFRVARVAQRSMIEDLNERLFSAPLGWHEGRHSGDTASRVSQSSGAVFAFSLGQFGYVESLILTICPLFVLFALSPLICLLAIAGFVFMAAFCLIVDRYQLRFWVKESDAHRVFGTALVDFFRNIMAIYASRRERSVSGILDGKLRDAQAVSKTNVLITEAKWSAVEVIATALGLSLLVIYVLQSIASGTPGGVELGNVFIVQTYLQGGTAALLGLVSNLSVVMRQRTDFATAEPILEVPVASRPAGMLRPGWRELAIEDVRFAYQSSDEPVVALNGVSLKLKRGRHYALIGPNGSGKSTLLKVLSGLLEPDVGDFAVDGAPSAPGVVRNCATLVPQTPELLNGTIADNLFLLPDQAAKGDQAVRGIVDLLIAPLGVGLDSEVLESGANWSGGQRQRIALARGLLAAADSDIVLVDEPTSSIDAKAERVIFERLRAMYGEKCLVVALHNLELIEDFDEVIVMDCGRLTDFGAPSLVSARCEYVRSILSADDREVA